MAGFEALLLTNKDINELTKELSGGFSWETAVQRGNLGKSVNLASPEILKSVEGRI
jgi:hypothetical protein